jgi:uncharacterized protein YecE (DUF72 family)
MTAFWVGVSGFSYASWRGTFYRKGTKPERMLEAYSNRLNSVEINSTFYHMPTQATTSRWNTSTHEAFRFSFKVNREVTHIKKLRNVADDFQIFLKGLKPLEKKLGCVLVQLPPYMKQDHEILESFLNQKPEGIRVAMEFRHDSWFGEKLNELLSKYNVALCVADRMDMKPNLEKTADFAYARLRRDLYSKSELTDWAERLSEFAKDATDCFVYFKHDASGSAANTAAEFKAKFGA